MLRIMNPLSHFLFTDILLSAYISELSYDKPETQHETDLKVALPLKHLIPEQ